MNNCERKDIKDILKFEGIMSQGFGISPRIVMRDKRLTPEAKAIYAYFQSFAGSAGQAFPSRETILSELQMSKNRYYKHLDLLKTYGYVRVERNIDETGWKRGNIYIIVSNPEEDEKAVKKLENKTVPTVGTKKINNSSVKTRSSYRNLKIDVLINKYPEDKETILQIYKIIKGLEQSEEVKISGIVKKKDDITEMLSQLTEKHIITVLKAVKDNKNNIRNIRMWIQTCLHNSIYDTNTDIEKKVTKFNEAKEKNNTICDVKREPIDSEILEAEERIKQLLPQRIKANFTGHYDTVKQIDDEIKKLEEIIEKRKDTLLTIGKTIENHDVPVLKTS